MAEFYVSPSNGFYHYYYSMDAVGQFEIQISTDQQSFSPDMYDIRELIPMLQYAEALLNLAPNDKKERPLISYSVQLGSVRHIFTTALPLVVAAHDLIQQVAAHHHISHIPAAAAQALENLQLLAARKNYTFRLQTSLNPNHSLTIDAHTALKKTAPVWVNAEYYLYGKIINAGGKDRANIHLQTTDRGVLLIKTPINFLEQYPQNMLYKTVGIKATAQQHLSTNEMDTSSLVFAELVEYEPQYDDQYLDELIKKATPTWSGIADKDAWLQSLREGGAYDG